MSQWGANGFARRGTASAKVRVLLGAGKRALTIASEAPFRVRAANGKLYALPAGKQELGPALKVRP